MLPPSLLTFHWYVVAAGLPAVTVAVNFAVFSAATDWFEGWALIVGGYCTVSVTTLLSVVSTLFVAMSLYCQPFIVLVVVGVV